MTLPDDRPAVTRGGEAEVEAARKEFGRWTMRPDRSLPAGMQYLVLRADGDAFDVISEHALASKADAALSNQAWTAALEAAAQARPGQEGEVGKRPVDCDSRCAKATSKPYTCTKCGGEMEWKRGADGEEGWVHVVAQANPTATEIACEQDAYCRGYAAAKALCSDPATTKAEERVKALDGANERLRSVLRPFADAYKNARACFTGPVTWAVLARVCDYYVSGVDFRNAAALLSDLKTDTGGDGARECKAPGGVCVYTGQCNTNRYGCHDGPQMAADRIRALASENGGRDGR